MSILKMAESVGMVETKYFYFDRPFRLESDALLEDMIIAFETYGNLNSNADNAVLICHALSGDSHAAGYHQGEHKPGWWDDMIGPGKSF